MDRDGGIDEPARCEWSRWEWLRSTACGPGPGAIAGDGRERRLPPAPDRRNPGCTGRVERQDVGERTLPVVHDVSERITRWIERHAGVEGGRAP